MHNIRVVRANAYTHDTNHLPSTVPKIFFLKNLLIPCERKRSVSKNNRVYRLKQSVVNWVCHSTVLSCQTVFTAYWKFQYTQLDTRKSDTMCVRRVNEGKGIYWIHLVMCARSLAGKRNNTIIKGSKCGWNHDQSNHKAARFPRCSNVFFRYVNYSLATENISIVRRHNIISVEHWFSPIPSCWSR